MRNIINKIILTVFLALTIIPCNIVKAEDMPLSDNQIRELTMLANIFDDEYEDAYRAVTNWIDGDEDSYFFTDMEFDESSYMVDSCRVYNFFLPDAEGNYTDEQIRMAKDNIYIFMLMLKYSFDYAHDLDASRCVLDHYMPMKEDLLFMIDIYNEPGQDEQDIVETIENLFFGDYIHEDPYPLSGGLRSIIMDTFYDCETDPDEFYDSFRYVFLEEANSEVSPSKFDTLTKIVNAVGSLRNEEYGDELVEKINEAINNDDLKQIMKQELFNEIEQAIADDTLDDLYDKDDEAVATILYQIIDIFGTCSRTLCATKADYLKGVINNAGPMLYKMLDLMEAIRDDDTPNILILCNEACDDMLLLYENIFDEPVMELAYAKSYYEQKLRSCCYYNLDDVAYKLLDVALEQLNNATTIEECEKIADRFMDLLNISFASDNAKVEIVNADGYEFLINNTYEDALLICTNIDDSYIDRILRTYIKKDIKNYGRSDLFNLSLTTYSRHEYDGSIDDLGEGKLANIVVDYDNLDKNYLRLYRFRDNKVELIPFGKVNNNTDGEYYEIIGDKAILHIRYLGDYAFGYINSFNVVYMLNGKKYRQVETYDEGDLVKIRDGLTLQGYTFSGWSRKHDFRIHMNTVITGELKKNTYTVTYLVNGKQYGDVETYEYGDIVTIKAEPIKSGYRFSGWSITEGFRIKDNIAIMGEFTPITYSIPKTCVD